MSPILSRLNWAQGFGRRPYSAPPGSAIYNNIEDFFSTYNYYGSSYSASYTKKDGTPVASTDSPFTGTGEGYYSVEFGLNNSIAFDTSNYFDYGNTKSFTIEWWEKRFEAGGNPGVERDPYMTVMDLGNTSAGLFIGLNGTNQGKYYITMGNGGTTLLTETTGVAAGTGWHHYALSVKYANSSQTYRFFRDGVEQDNSAGSGVNWGSNNSDFTIGGQKAYPASYNFQGRISNFRVTTGISRYNANFSVPTKPFADWADGTNVNTQFVCCKSPDPLGADGDILTASAGITKKTRVKYLEKGGMVWIKSRTSGQDHCLVDTLRGKDRWLNVSNNNAETNDTNNIYAFTNDGFTTGGDSRVNNSGEEYTSWSFAKNSKFLDIVEYTGDGATSRYIDHTLDDIPGFIVIKNVTQSSTGWVAIHKNAQRASIPGQGVLQMNSAFSTQFETGNTPADNYPSLGGPANKTNQFHVTSNWNNYESSGGEGYFGTNNNGEKYIAYIFAHDESEDGMIRCGYFDTDGSGVSPISGGNSGYNDLGWEPQWIMTKRICDTTSYGQLTGNWYIWDDKRGVGTYSRFLRVNGNDAESGGSSNQIRFKARGFRCKSLDPNNRYIYVAIRKGLLGNPKDTKRKAIDLFALGRGGTTCSGNNDGFGTQIADGGEVTEATGQQAYLTPGTYQWTCPANVTKVHAVCIGAGGGGTSSSGGGGGGGGGNFEAGGGGGLGWKNNIPVTPGQTYTVVVGDHGPQQIQGSDGNDSYFINATTVKGGGGKGNNGGGGDFVGEGGGNGGAHQTYGGGGGAGGYSANGNSESGGSAGRGSANGLTGGGAGGGGVGVLGEGSSGSNSAINNNYGGIMYGGQGGSGGSAGTNGTVPTFSGGYSGGVYGGPGGNYGGGGGGNAATNYGTNQSALGAAGAVRIIWGTGRSFPSTNTADQPSNQGTNTAVKSYGFAPDMGFTLQSYDTSGGARETFSRVSGTSSNGRTGDTVYQTKWDLDGNVQGTDTSNTKWLLNGGNCGGNNLGSNDIIWNWRRAKGFFDTCYFYSNGNANQPYPHNLGVVPEMIWYRRLDTNMEGMFVYHKDMPVTQYGLTASTQISTGSNLWGDGTVPHTATNFTMGDTAGNNYENVAYLFATCPGISKVGKYDTLANGDPQNIDCGFTSGVRAVIIKQITSSQATSSTLGWYCFDTARGIAQQTTATSGSTNFVSSTGDMLKILGHQNGGGSFFLGTGAYTIEFWIKTTASAGWIMFNAGSNTGFRICVGNNGSTGSNDGKIEVNEQISNNDDYTTSSSTINDGQWHHIAITRPPSDGTNGPRLKIFVDGTHEGTGNHDRNCDSNDDCWIGRRQSGGGYALNGQLSNFRVRSSCIYTSDFTPPIAPLDQTADTKLLFLQSTTDPLTAAVTPGTVSYTGGAMTASSDNPFSNAATPHMRLDNTSHQQISSTPWIKRTDSGFRIESGNTINNANETYIYYAIA
tara:strand:+ start:15377 stop:19771 length:4395 start_codon:yes stop_codon:yes gene_type:complete